ncbi:hypothetical protein ACSSS7_006120 [Eimeria intestinalis]
MESYARQPVKQRPPSAASGCGLSLPSTPGGDRGWGLFPSHQPPSKTNALVFCCLRNYALDTLASTAPRASPLKNPAAAAAGSEPAAAVSAMLPGLLLLLLRLLLLRAGCHHKPQELLEGSLTGCSAKETYYKAV